MIGPQTDVAAVVLAAGEGKRLHTGLAKVLHRAAGRPLIDHVLDAVAPLGVRPLVVVVGHLREQVAAHLVGGQASTVVQDPPRGTADAVAQALPLLPEQGRVLVLSGDVPLLTTATLERLLEALGDEGNAIALATAVLDDGGGYGRVVRDREGRVAGIVEARDASREQLSICEVNAGTYAFDIAALRAVVPEISADNAQGEYYLTDAVELLAARGGAVTVVLDDPEEMAGVNTRAQLAAVHRALNQRVVAALQTAGVTVLDPDTTWVDAACVVGRDTVLEPGVHLRGRCVVGAGCQIGAHAVLDGIALADGTVVPPLTRLPKEAG